MTRILGKDAPLEVSIETMSARLKQLGFVIEEVNWLNPVPHVWSVHIRDKHCPMLFTNGKGATQDAARASALGEFFERLSCNYFFADYYLGSHVAEGEFVHYPNERWFAVPPTGFPAGLLDSATLAHYNVDDELTADMLVDTNSGNGQRGICALPFVRQSDGESVWFPVNIIGNLYVSNGMAAGNSCYEARVQALSEIFERHIKNTIIASGISLPPIPQAVLERYPTIAAAVEALREHGFIVYVLDASLGGKFPLVNVTLLDRDSGGCFASFGAHPKFEVALERTVTELLQGRALDQLDQFPEPCLDLQLVADPHNLETHFIDSSGLVSWDLLSNEPDYPYTAWNIEGDTQAEFHALCERIHHVDLDIYIADYRHLGVYCCRILVPGMSEIYPVEELVWNNNNVGIELRQPIFALATLDRAQLQALYQQLDSLGLDEPQLIPELLGLAVDQDHWLAGMRVAQLKMLLALALQDLDTAQQALEWLLHFGEVPKNKLRLYRCLQQLLAFHLAEPGSEARYRAILAALYGEVLLAEAERLLAGQQVFANCSPVDSALQSLTKHRELLTAYERLQRAKAGLFTEGADTL